MDEKKPSHKLWRKNAKKLQRKRRRCLVAKQREAELNAVKQSPLYQVRANEERALELILLENIEQMNKIEHNKWIEYEKQVELKWNEQKLKIEEHTKKVEAERRRIQEEFENEQKRVAQAVELKKQLIEEQRQREIDLERRIQAYIDGMDDKPPELLDEAETNPGKEQCPIFMKTSSCRFGNKCIRNHKRPKISRILMLPAFFINFCLDQSKETEYGNDISLEHDENDLNTDFNEFFADVIPEFENLGQILNFLVCKNTGPQLRGYVFVEYDSERDAFRAQRVMHGRYYAGRMLNVEFSNISWRTAVCGASLMNICRNGKNCNYLHIFKNPCDLYSVEKTLQQCRTNSYRNSSVNNSDQRNWNFKDERNHRNWRWSDSPIKETVDKNVENLEMKRQHNTKRSRSRSRSSSSNRSSNGLSHRKKSRRSRRRSRSQSNRYSQSFSRSHKKKSRRSRSRSNSHFVGKLERHNRTHSKKKRQRSSRSKERKKKKKA